MLFQYFARSRRAHSKFFRSRILFIVILSASFCCLLFIDVGSISANPAPAILLSKEWEDADHIERDTDGHDDTRYLRWLKEGSPLIVLPLRNTTTLEPNVKVFPKSDFVARTETPPPQKNVNEVSKLVKPSQHHVSPKRNLTETEREEAESRRAFSIVKRKRCVKMRFDEKAQRLRVHIFVIHHGGASRYIAKAFQYCREEWVTLVQLPKTPFFESGLTLSHFSDDRLAQMERDYDYFFITGYKVLSHEIEPIFRYASEEMLEHMALYARATGASCDAFAYHDDTYTPSFLEENLKKHHPNSTWDATLAVLADMQFTEEQLEKANTIRVFMRNTYMIKSTSMRVFARYTRSALNHMRRNEATLQFLESDAEYAGATPQVAMQMFNQSYYMQHPFVFERMTSVFMVAAGLEVCYRFAGDYFLEHHGGP